MKSKTPARAGAENLQDDKQGHHALQPPKKQANTCKDCRYVRAIARSNKKGIRTFCAFTGETVSLNDLACHSFSEVCHA